MRFVAGVTRPTIEGVIERHARCELLKIVGIHARQAERGGKKSRRFRRKIKPVGVRGPDDGGEFRERRGFKPKLIEYRVKRAALAAMTPRYALDVECSAVEALRDRENFGRIQGVALKYGITAELIGETAPEQIEIKLDGRVVVSAAVSELREVYEGALEKALRTESELVAAD